MVPYNSYLRFNFFYDNTSNGMNTLSLDQNILNFLLLIPSVRVFWEMDKASMDVLLIFGDRTLLFIFLFFMICFKVPSLHVFWEMDEALD